MAKFPNDSELHHVSGVEVPDDANHYAVKDDYARELIDILNREKSEVYIGKDGVTGSSQHYMGCYLNPSVFSTDNFTDLITLTKVVIDVDIRENTPITGIMDSYIVNLTNTQWENLTSNFNYSMDKNSAPIRVRFFYFPINGTITRTVSGIIMSESSTTDNVENTDGVHIYSGTGVIYTGDTIDDFVNVLVRMKLQETDGKKQAVITVTELPKELSGGGGSGDGFNAYVETEVLNLVKE